MINDSEIHALITYMQVDRHFTEDAQSIKISVSSLITCVIHLYGEKSSACTSCVQRKKNNPNSCSHPSHIFQIILIVSVYPGMVASVVTTPFFSIRINSRSPKIRVRSIPSTKAIGLLIRASVPAPSPHPWEMR